MGCRTFVFNGNNVRNGLCEYRNFRLEERAENIGRIAEMVNLFWDAGMIALAAFISPLEKDRRWEKDIIGSENMIEIFCDCPIEACEVGDVKGL